MYSSVKRQISTMQKPLLYLHQPSISFGEYSVFDDSQVDGYLGIFNISSSGDIVLTSMCIFITLKIKFLQFQA